MSGSVSRVIAIMEALAKPSEKGLTAQEVVELSGLPASTGYRILTELQELGLVHKGTNRKLLANFNFQRRLHSSSLDLERLALACSELSLAFESSSEVVVLSGQHMLWHIVEQHPDQAIRLRAHPGFMRNTYELDSISRLALAHLPKEEIEQRWDTRAFYSTGVDRHLIDWTEACAAIEAVDVEGMQFDMRGNAKGVRRYSVAVHGEERELSCLLTIAEAAIPVRDEEAHVSAIRDKLMAQKAIIEQGQSADSDTG